MMRWLKDTARWFRTHWLEWVLVLVYIGILYWMASFNWQVIYFTRFFGVFLVIAVALVISFRYIKSEL
jgi:hypothetical protein